MTQYASFDPSVADPKPVKGWYDTGIVTYPNLPAASDLLAVTAAQWAQHMADLNAAKYAIVAGALMYTEILPTPAPTLAQQAAAALAAGLQVTSSAAPSLDGTYAVDTVTQGKISGLLVASVAGLSLPSPIQWPDMSGAPHAFSIAQFKQLAQAILGFTSAMEPIANGAPGTLPTQPVNIDSL